MQYLKLFENFQNETLIIVDVQKSFKKFFTEMYLHELKKYCENFSEVYQLWDNHVNGKNVDKDYLFDDNPDIPVHSDLYNFPNQTDIIEKRYRYGVDVDFFKKNMSKGQYHEIKHLENEKKLKVGDLFKINGGIIIVFIGNNHNWFECTVKLYNLLKSLSGREVTIVGGADNECLQDIFVTAESLGVKIKRDWKFIYTATSCPI
jgi:hypothetical protein